MQEVCFNNGFSLYHACKVQWAVPEKIHTPAQRKLKLTPLSLLTYLPPPLVGHLSFKYLHLPLDIYVVHAFRLINLSIHQQHYFLQSATPWINLHLNASPLRRHFSPLLNGNNFLLGGGMDLFLDRPNNYTFCHTILEIYGYTVMQESLLPKLRLCLNCQSHLKLRHRFNLNVDSRMKWIRPPRFIKNEKCLKSICF